MDNSVSNKLNLKVIIPIIIIAPKNARIKLKIGPAAMPEKRLQTELLLNVPSALSSPSSPRIIQEPPKGISFSEYLVVPRCVDSILGPIPTENSSTTMPFVFASKKCPNSCTIITIPRIRTAIILLKHSTCFPSIHRFLLQFPEFLPDTDVRSPGDDPWPPGCFGKYPEIRSVHAGILQLPAHWPH